MGLVEGGPSKADLDDFFREDGACATEAVNDSPLPVVPESFRFAAHVLGEAMDAHVQYTEGPVSDSDFA